MSFFERIKELIPGTAATDLGKAQDAAAGATDTGVALLAKRVNYASVAAITPAAGDYALLQVDELGRLHVCGGPYDPISRIPVSIDYDHHQLHEGETFRWSTYVSSLASGNSKDIRLVVPNITITSSAVQQCPHFRFEVVGSAQADVFLYEGPTFSGNGTQRTPIAMERNGSYTPKLEIHEDPTVSGVGTQLYRGLILASKNAAGNTENSIIEFILKNNTSYLLRCTSQAANNIILVRMVWYEDLGV